jgi:hypothetical protein
MFEKGGSLPAINLTRAHPCMLGYERQAILSMHTHLASERTPSFSERIVGIEPTKKGWKPFALPFGHTRKPIILFLPITITSKMINVEPSTGFEPASDDLQGHFPSKRDRTAFLLYQPNTSWNQGDSNPQPLGCKPNALPFELQPHLYNSCYSTVFSFQTSRFSEEKQSRPRESNPSPMTYQVIFPPPGTERHFFQKTTLVW